MIEGILLLVDCLGWVEAGVKFDGCSFDDGVQVCRTNADIRSTPPRSFERARLGIAGASNPRRAVSSRRCRPCVRKEERLHGGRMRA